MAKFLSILSWFFSILLILISLGAFSKSAILSGFFIILIGLVLLPPLGKLFHFNLLIKSLLVIILAICAGVSMPKSPTSPNQTASETNPYQNPPTSQTGNIVEKKWPDGKLWQRYTVDKGGKMDGLATYWGEDGIKTVEENYIHGVQNGVSTMFHENGAKNDSFFYKDGNIEGIVTEWSEKGIKLRQIPYLHGNKQGLEIWYNANNQIERETPYVNDTISGMETEYENGVIFEKVPYVKGKKNGIGIRTLKNKLGTFHVKYVDDKEIGFTDSPEKIKRLNNSIKNSYDSLSEDSKNPK